MSASIKGRTAVMMVLLLLAAGCGQVESPATPVTPAALVTAILPAATSLPPTATPVPPTATSLPPDATPAPPTATLTTAPTFTSAPEAAPLESGSTEGRREIGGPPPGSTLSAVAAEVGAHLEDLATQDQFSGAVLIAYDGEPLFEGAFGLANRAPDVPNQIDTRFNLGSMNKMFTGVAILQLVEQGKLSLEVTIADVLPDYPNSQLARAVTIHQLLTHTSGMGDWSESKRFPDLHDQIRSLEDYLPLFVDTPLEFEPGDRFRYSNSGYIVLGLIIERVTGGSYYEYVRTHIFEPSGMANTAAYELDGDVPNLAVGYTRVAIDGSELAELTDHRFAMPMKGGSSGGGFSTAEDLLRFGNALMDHRLLSPESTDLLLAGKVRLNDHAQYAYGFIDKMVEDQRVVGHSGGAPGICDFVDVYLDQGYTVVVLSNSDGDCLAAGETIKAALSSIVALTPEPASSPTR